VCCNSTKAAWSWIQAWRVLRFGGAQKPRNPRCSPTCKNTIISCEYADTVPGVRGGEMCCYMGLPVVCMVSLHGVATLMLPQHALLLCTRTCLTVHPTCATPSCMHDEHLASHHPECNIAHEHTQRNSWPVTHGHSPHTLRSPRGVHTLPPRCDRHWH
jgi:hypothetical protein